MVARAVGLRTRAQEDPEGLGTGAGRRNRVRTARLGGGLGGQEAESGQEGEEEAQHGGVGCFENYP